MKAAETVTVVLQTPTDFTGPLIGILGVLIGSAFAFISLRWQHKAQQNYDVRKKCADLISIGDTIAVGYLERFSGFFEFDEAAILSANEGRVEEMRRILQHLQLIATPKLQVRAQEYVNAADNFAAVTLLESKTKRKGRQESLTRMQKQWWSAREHLVNALRPKRYGPTGVGNRVRVGLGGWKNKIKTTSHRKEAPQ